MRGHKFEFYIFGYGQLEKYIENYIADKNEGKYVFMMGKLEYEKIYQLMEDAFMFVLMGTAVIEASSIGVLLLKAIDSEKRPVLYGPFNNLSVYCIGENKPDLPLIDMRNSILELFQKNQFEYEEICTSHIDRANTFHIDKVVKQYYKFLKMLAPI